MLIIPTICWNCGHHDIDGYCYRYRLPTVEVSQCVRKLIHKEQGIEIFL